MDLDELRACIEPPGRMLPAQAYLDPDVLAFERRALFAGGWVCAGRSSTLPRGSRRAQQVGDDSILLVRDDRSTLRAFYNVCRHRAHELLPCGQTARGRTIACPYHGWTYDTQGRQTRPGTGTDLIEVPVEEWHGFVFVNASGDAPPLRDYLAGLDELAAPYEMSGMAVRATHEYVLRANWKLVAENYHECYHCPEIHPELCRASPPDSGDNYDPGQARWAGGSMTLNGDTMSLDGRSPTSTDRNPGKVIYVQLYPNLLLSMHPDYVLTHLVEPLTPSTTRITCEWLFRDEEVDPAYAVDFWDLTNRQDWAACESVQRGVSSRGYVPGPLAGREDCVHRWIAAVATAYQAGMAARR
ncbi:SRPBCC family protein [Nonomuraea sp. NPDC050556]|uniref:aromatic ring-hydroxylating oxygenase subunit alpha n=1 Tax=Nonomuraea sp. NPDC050556 TaxID=3364369 RepID=UPI003793F952